MIRLDYVNDLETIFLISSLDSKECRYRYLRSLRSGTQISRHCSRFGGILFVGEKICERRLHHKLRFLR